MLRLVYCSEADFGDADATNLAIKHILEASRRNNARDDVTGALLFSEGSFAQILEGPDEAVTRIFARVRKDPRHHDVAVVIEEPATERLFADWSMSFTVAGEAVQELAPAALRRCRDEPGEAAAQEILGLIRMGLDGVQIW